MLISVWAVGKTVLFNTGNANIRDFFRWREGILSSWLPGGLDPILSTNDHALDGKIDH